MRSRPSVFVIVTPTTLPVVTEPDAAGPMKFPWIRLSTAAVSAIAVWKP